MAKLFNGTMELDIRDSVADWDAFTAQKPPEGAPNVLVVLDDDTGCAAWSPYGGRIEMPTMDRLAANGLTYRVVMELDERPLPPQTPVRGESA